MSNPTASEVIREQLASESLVNRARLELQESRISFSLKYCEPTDNPAVLVDVDGPLGIGRITWWADGSLYAEAIRQEDGETLLSQHLEAQFSEQAVAALKQIAGLLFCPASNPSSQRTGFAGR